MEPRWDAELGRYEWEPPASPEAPPTIEPAFIREAAREQLVAYRISVKARIISLSAILASIDAMLTRLSLIQKTA